MDAKNPELWFAFGYDPVSCTLSVLAIGHSEAEAMRKAASEAGEFDVQRAFQALTALGQSNAGFTAEMFTWLRDCKIPAEDAKKLIREFGAQMSQIVEESAAEAERRRACSGPSTTGS